jgi:ABC-type phosphate transport system substrate-binding protein
MKRFLTALLVLAASALLARPVLAQGYLVIVNDANPSGAMSASDVSQLFLKQQTRWSNGQLVVPVDQVEDASVREAFSQAVHRRSTSAVEAFWQRQIFSGRAVPPVKKASDEEVIAFVRANPNAVGYVSPGAALGAGVRRLRID